MDRKIREKGAAGREVGSPESSLSSAGAEDFSHLALFLILYAQEDDPLTTHLGLSPGF